MILPPNSRTAIGLFDSRDKAESAIAALYAAGFISSEIGILARRTSEWQDYRHPSPTMVVTERTEESVVSGAATGAAAGAGIGGLWALGIAGGLLPVVGPIIAGGVLASVLASAAMGAATGSLVGALIGLGVPEEDARNYDAELASGRTLVTVRADGRYEEAMNILFDHGAVQVSPRIPDYSSPVAPRR